MEPASTFLKLLAVLLLVAINAFFVAAEFSLVGVRRTRIEQRVREGDSRARRVLAALDRPDDFISAAQLGITLASIGIGYIAEDTVHAMLFPLIDRISFDWAVGIPLIGPSLTAHAFALLFTLAFVTYLHVVLGEQIPKMISIQRSEAVVFWTVVPTQWFGAALRPFIRFMSGSANAGIRAVGMEPTGVHTLAHTPEEIRILVEQSHQAGEVEAGAEQMISGVLDFRETFAREVMTPRRDIIALPVDATREEVLDLAVREGHSRIPVYDGDLDTIVGILLVKDLLPVISRDARSFDLRRVLREPYFVPDMKPTDDLLGELRARNTHMAIVVDEFGGTEGLVTLEDLLEEIVGEIYDEYDLPEPDFALTAEGHILIDGSADIEDVNERFGLQLPQENFETIGGFVFGELGRVAQVGDTVSLNGSGQLRVEQTGERRVISVRLILPPPAEPPTAGGPDRAEAIEAPEPIARAASA